MISLQVHDLSVGYDSHVVAEHIDFSLHTGDYLIVIGENGSGKTTLMRTLLGLMRPIAGSMKQEGFSQNQIGYLPQQTDIQRDFPATVEEVVLSGCLAGDRFRFFYHAADKKRAEDNMKRTGILPLRKKSYRALSGGQQQRVLLARALSAADEILLLDEPVTGLDPEATAEMYWLVQDLNREGMTILMISHDLGAAENYASHILKMGKTPFFGTREEYLKFMKGGAK